MKPARPLDQAETEILEQLQAGRTVAEITKALAGKLGGPGRITYCINELRGLGLFNDAEQCLTPRGCVTTTTTRKRKKTRTTTTGSPAAAADDTQTH